MQNHGKVCSFCEKPITIHFIPIKDIPNFTQLVVPLEHFECERLENQLMRLQNKIFKIRMKQDELRQIND